ncbi:MAG: putative Ig domain-containing protein [Chitinophagaceae bacterium]
MKKSYLKKWMFRLVFTTLTFLSISNVHAQPANLPPLLKYAINNYSTIAKAVDDCDTCLPLVGKPLRTFRPIPFPLSAAANLIPGVDINEIPGLAAPNFFGGGSPEIKGLVKEVAGMTDAYAKSILGRSELLYFKSGAQGVAVSKTGKIYTSSLTVPPGAGRADINPQRVNGFFSFKSEPFILPKFNSISEEAFTASPEKTFFQDVERNNYDLEVAHFALLPDNENIVYAAFENEVNLSKKLARKNRAGNWVEVERYFPGGLSMPTTFWGALAVDKDGNLYVADDTHHVIVKITFDANGKASSWKIIAGKLDTPGFVNDVDGDDSTESRFNKPSGICLDNAGNIYVGDAGNNVIRKIDPDGDVTTYAGNENGEAGTTDDNDWNDAKFDGPTAVAYNNKTNTLYVVDFNRKTIREINAARNVSTVAGLAGSVNPIADPKGFAMNLYYVLAKLNMDPDEAKFTSPTGIAIDPSGFGLYVSDGKYIKYVNTSETIFTITHAIGDPKANVLGLPVLPLGIKMNPNNGSFYGVPLLPWEPTTYTISITNHVVGLGILGIVPNGAITFEVVNCPDIPDTVYVNQTIRRNQLPYTWNGKLMYDAGTTTVKLSGAFGCDSIVKLNLTLSPELSYNSLPYILSFGQQIKPIVPTTAGSKIDTFTVAPLLPAGLLLNAQTGVITGTPTVYVPANPVPAVGPRTPPSYPGPWTLQSGNGADLTGFKISDGNAKTVFENNSGFRSLQGSAGLGTGTAGAYTDYSGLGPIKMFSNNPYSVQMSNTLGEGNYYSLNDLVPSHNYMNSYAVYIDYNRDGDFADAGERVYISAGPQRNAHTETFNLNIPASAAPGVTKMRIYAVEAWTRLQSYEFYDANRPGTEANKYYFVYRTTEQALSFYPFFNDISMRGEQDFQFINYGEFEDYNIDIVTAPSQGFVVTGSNTFGSAQSTVKLAVSNSTSSTTNLTICQSQLPYKWNNLIFTAAGSKTDTLTNLYAADSLATLNLSVKQSSSSAVYVAYCGPYTYLGKVYTESGWYYGITIPNAAGCDSSISLNFRQKATGSTTDMLKTPDDLPFTWNGMEIRTAGTYYYRQPNSEGCDSLARLVLRVQYTITYPTNNLLTLNRAITPLRPQIQGGYVPPEVWYNEVYGYSIAPALPAGLLLDPVTGIISGTPTVVSPLKTYTITLNQDGAQPARFTLSVGAPSFSTTTINNCGPLNWNGVVYDKAGTFIANLKNQYGYDSTATLILTIRNLSSSITNINLNLSQLPFIWNDTSITKEGLYTVHFVNAVGCDSAATANVVISPKISYFSPQILLHNQLITAITPQNLGGKVLNFTITPSLVRGLNFDAFTGTISGTPTDTLVQPVSYTVRAFNRAGADSTNLVVAVCNAMATSFTMNTCDRYVWNDSTYTKSTTHPRTLKNRGGCDSVVTMNLIIRKATKGLTDNITACANYVWYGVTYDSTGLYTKVYTNAVGCDSTIYLNLTIKKPTENNLYVNLNASDFPYTWRNKTFNAPGRDSIMKVNSVGCDSTVWMNVRISAVLPDISYAVGDTVLYWEQTINPPIAMTNTGTAIPAMKLGERDTLIKFSNGGPGDHLRNIVKGPDGAYYASIVYQNNIYKLSSSGAWTEFANVGASIKGMAMDRSGNLYAGTSLQVKKITPDGVVSNLDGLPRWTDGDALAVDADNNLVVADGNIDKQLTITKFNLSTGQLGQMIIDHSPYFDYGEIDMEADSKGNIYIFERMGTVILKIKPNGHISNIGRKDSDYRTFKPANGTDALIPEVYSMAIDRTNDNLYLMAYRQLLRVDTAENVTAITGKWFDLYRDHIFRVDGGKASILNNTTAILYTANVHGVGSLPFMDNYGVSSVDIYGATINFTDYDKRIRLDSSGSIVGTARAKYSSIGTIYAYNTTTAYSIIGANQYGISTAPMVITNKTIYYKRENFVTTTLPFIWRGRSFNAATDTATYFVSNKTDASDTLYRLNLVYEGSPEPTITSNCVTGGVSLVANGAAKNAISFDGTNMGLIKNVDGSGGSGLAYYGADWTTRPDGSTIVYFQTAFEVWIKPATVSGTQYLLTRDTLKTHGTFVGYSIQNGKFVYEFTKGISPFVDYKLSSTLTCHDESFLIFLCSCLFWICSISSCFVAPFLG